METVLVTGAAGTVGSYVVSLAEAAGYRVVVNDLSSRGVRVPVRGEVRAGDVCDPGFVRGLVRGCDHVIHAAAQLDVGADAAELSRNNTTAVIQLFEAAHAAGAKRFVHVSTAMVYEAGQPMPLVESSKIAPRGAHGLSKQGAEAYLLGRNDGPAWTILRAAPLYGRKGRHFAASLLSIGPMLRLFSPLLPRPTGGPLGTMVHAEDVARALLFVLRDERAVREVFNVSDGDVIALGDRIAGTFAAYGLRTAFAGRAREPILRWLGRTFQAPGAYQGADATAIALWRLVALRHRLKPALRPRLDREALTLLYDPLVVDAGRLRALGWRPRFSSFTEGWRDVLRWYQAERWVPRYV